MGGAGVTAAVTFVGKWLGTATFAQALTAAAFTFLVSKASSMLAKEERSEPFSQGRTQTVRQEAAPRQIIYGESRVGGIFTFMRTTDNNRYLHMIVTLSGHEVENIGDVYFDDDVVQADGSDIIEKFRGERDSGDVTVNNKRFEVANPKVGSEIDLTGFRIGTIVRVSGFSNNTNNGDHRITDIVVDEPNDVIYMEVETTLVNEAKTSATFESDYVHISKHVGFTNQEADLNLVRLIDDWTLQHRQRECAYIYLRIRWNRDKWPTGIPNLSAVVQGKNDIYDPRDDTNKYTTNPALCIADFLTWERYGFGADYDTEINETELIASANVCDEDVDLADGGTETRYTCNGAMSSGTKIAPNLNAIMGSMAGEVIWSGGQWYILAGYYRTPEVTFDEDDMTGGLSIITGVSRNQLFNSIKGTYVSPENRYIEAGFPAVTNSTYVSNDGGEKTWENIELPFTDSPSMAQRIAKIQLEQVRQQITVSMPVNLKGLRVKAGDVVKVTNARMGWTEKPFEVTDWELALENPDENPIFGVNLELRETASGVYDWNSGEETTVDLAPDTDLPDPFSVTAPTNLTVKSGTAQLYRKKDGTVVTRTRMDWTASVDSFVQEYEVQYKRSSDSEWQAGGKPEGEDTHWYIWDVEDGEDYDHRIRAINPFGPRSDWLTDTNHTVIGKTAPPEDVTSLAATTANWISGGSKQYGIHLTWDDVSDADLGRYEVRTDTNFGTKAGRLARPKDNQVQLPIASAGSYTFYIKAQDTSKNYSTNATSTSITIEAPDAPSGVTATTTNKLDGNAKSYGIRLNWTNNENDFPIVRNHVYLSGQLIDSVSGTESTLPITTEGSYTFEVESEDVAGNVSSRGSESITINPPGQPQVDEGFSGPDFRLTWTAATEEDFPVSFYEIRYGGTDFDSATAVDTVQAREIKFRADWIGSRTWRIAAYDVAGNRGASGSTAVQIEGPDAPPDLGAKVIAIDVLLNWNEVSGTLPTDRYKVYRNKDPDAAFGDSGTHVQTTVDGTFASVKEDTPQDYRYWITAVDTAGNESSPSTVRVTVEELNDFVVQGRFPDDFTGGTTSDTFVKEPGVNALIGPYDVSNTVDDHYSGYSTTDDIINDGYTYVLQPTRVTTGTYQNEYDINAVLSQTLITVSFDTTVLDGDPTVSVTIEGKESSGDSYSLIANNTQGLGNQIRYIRITLTVDSDSDDDLLQITNLETVARIRKVTSEDVATADKDDEDGTLGGTAVTLDRSFLDIRAVEVSIKGNSQPQYSVFADWDDVQGQDEIHIWVYDQNGVRQTADVSYIVRGVVG